MLLLKKIGYYNGKIGLLDQMRLPMLDRAVYFGDGVYDVAMVRNGKPFAFKDHVDRFMNSLALVRINLGMSHEKLEDELKRIIDAGSKEADEFVLYWQASRGTAARGHAFPDGEVKANLYAYTAPKNVGSLYDKFKLCRVEDRRYQFCHVKTLNLILNVLASQTAAEMGCDEALFHRGDIVTEGSHTSISILAGGKFITPPLSDFILPSTSRKHLLEICAEENIPYEERNFTLDELKNADEVIIASATILCRTASHLDSGHIGGKAPVLYGKIADNYYSRYINETK